MNKNIVTSRLAGGLGNYLFQIAAAQAYGLKHNKEAVFNSATAMQVHKNIDSYKGSILRNVKFDSNFKVNNQLNEQGFHYTELPKVDKNVYLTGYFQSEKYFKDYEKEIRDLFSCPEDIKQDLRGKYFFNNEFETCSIHVRRGDYLQLQDTHPVQNMPYFMKALKKMPKDCNILVFSDDIQWCRDSFPSMGDRITFVSGQSDIEDLYLMSMCDHNIICNSTFSWWAAWLNKNPDKIVVAPKNWFGPVNAHLDTKDIYPESWIKI